MQCPVCHSELASPSAAFCNHCGAPLSAAPPVPPSQPAYTPPPAGYPPRFVDLTDLYSARLRQVARVEDTTLEEGVYAALTGPNYETPAEVAMLRGLGADLVGMSTALEAIAARHLGAEVLGVSLVTNAAAGHDVAIDHEEVIAAGAAAADTVGSLLAAVIRRLP